ncbi:MAG: type II secretion system GspH family protein [Armatimonadetes bacterium]|nr:type II secretion system GspH family protein [Armatimonadota bacterium]
MRLKKAFTLIELITVMAITAILLTIITIPVVQSFNLTRAAQSFANAQERARLLIDQITRDIANGSGVRDNSGVKGACAVVVPGRNGALETILLANTKIDVFEPAAAPYSGASGALKNPNSLIDPSADPTDPANWREDPTLKAPVGQPIVPASQGFRLSRYFLALRDPFLPYLNPYDGLLMKQSGGQDNLFVLRKAQVAYRTLNAGTWTFNNKLFVDVDADSKPDNVDSPYFMIPGVDDVTGTALAGAALTAKNDRIRAWLGASRIVTDFSRYDMILPVYDRASRAVTFVGNVPQLISLVTFAPTRVSNETPNGQLAVREGEESSNAIKIGPDVFRTVFGGWSQSVITNYPSTPNGWQVNPVTSNPLDRNETADRFDVNGNYIGTSIFFGGATEVFDVSEYNYASTRLNGSIAAGNLMLYPFSYAVQQANSRSNFKTNALAMSNFIPFGYDKRTGKITSSFGITEVGNGGPFNTPSNAGFSNPEDNRPESFVGPAATPANDPSLAGASSATRWQGNAYNPGSTTSQINQRFNVLWLDWDLIWAPQMITAGDILGNKAELCKRFIDLRNLRNKDGEPSPLHPTFGFNRARLVPGSEIIVGPDQIDGPNKGLPTRYTRVTGQEIGPNQYRINYTDQPAVNWSAIGLVNPPAVYDPLNPISAILEAKTKAGYVEFNSDPTSPIPSGNISVSYRFQFNEQNDVFAVDYDTQQVITVNLTILTYPGGGQSPNPQQVTLKGSAAVRNFVR